MNSFQSAKRKKLKKHEKIAKNHEKFGKIDNICKKTVSEREYSIALPSAAKQIIPSATATLKDVWR